MYAERNWRLYQGPASDRTCRFALSAKGAISRPEGRSVVTGSGSTSRLPTGLPTRVTPSLGDAYEEGFPVISRLLGRPIAQLGQSSYPTRNFARICYLLTCHRATGGRSQPPPCVAAGPGPYLHLHEEVVGVWPLRGHGWCQRTSLLIVRITRHVVTIVDTASDVHDE